MPPRSMAMRRYELFGAIDMSATRKVQPLEEEFISLPSQVAPAEFRLVEFGIDVVMVEDEPDTENVFEEASGQEQEVGRVAGVENVEAAPEEDAPREDELPKQRRRVLDGIAERSLRFERQPMTVDVNSVDDLVSDFGTASLGADHGDFIAGATERGCFPTRHDDRKGPAGSPPRSKHDEASSRPSHGSGGCRR